LAACLAAYTPQLPTSSCHFMWCKQLTLTNVYACRIQVGRTLTVGGWVKTGREAGAGAFAFLEVNDGSCFDSIQVSSDSQMHTYSTSRCSRSTSTSSDNSSNSSRGAPTHPPTHSPLTHPPPDHGDQGGGGAQRRPQAPGSHGGSGAHRGGAGGNAGGHQAGVCGGRSGCWSRKLGTEQALCYPFRDHCDTALRSWQSSTISLALSPRMDAPPGT
jgi:hypothetical protein